MNYLRIVEKKVHAKINLCYTVFYENLNFAKNECIG